MHYKVELMSKAKEFFLKISDKSQKEKIKTALIKLQESNNPKTLNEVESLVEKLFGLYRLKVENASIIFSINEDEKLIFVVGISIK